MTHPNEYRTGNIVYDSFKPKKEVIQLTLNDFFCMRNFMVSNCRIPYKPIELTHDWLINLGFEVDEDVGDMIYYKLKGSIGRHYEICYNHEEWQFLLVSKDEYIVLIPDERFFQYVHQLQNIWFALTGIELPCEIESKPMK